MEQSYLTRAQRQYKVRPCLRESFYSTTKRNTSIERVLDCARECVHARTYQLYEEEAGRRSRRRKGREVAYEAMTQDVPQDIKRTLSTEQKP
jgi:hypothetical protein